MKRDIINLIMAKHLQKKVNPDLPVMIKPSNRARKMHEEKLKKQQLRTLVKRRREEEQRWRLEMRRVLLPGEVWMARGTTGSMLFFLFKI